MATSTKLDVNQLVMFTALGVGGYFLYRHFHPAVAAVDPLTGLPLPAPPVSALPPLTGGLYTPPVYTPPATPGTGVAQPSVLSPVIPAGTPADVAACMKTKQGVGWGVNECAARLNALKSAYAAAVQNITTLQAQGDGGRAQAMATIAASATARDAAIAQRDAQPDAASKAVWQSAATQHQAAIDAITQRLSSMTSGDAQVAAWTQAANDHAGDYYRLTGFRIA